MRDPPIPCSNFDTAENGLTEGWKTAMKFPFLRPSVRPHQQSRYDH